MKQLIRRGIVSGTDQATEGEPTPPVGFLERNRLKLVLVLGDAAAVLVGHAIVLLALNHGARYGYTNDLAILATSVVLGVWSIRSQGLLLSRVSAIRTLELSRIIRAMVVLAVGMLVSDRLFGFGLRIRQTAVAAGVSIVMLMIARSIYRSWLSQRRQHGLNTRRMVIIGADEEAARLMVLFLTHRDLGIEVVGVIGDRASAYRNGLAPLWLGSIENAETLIRSSRARGVVLTPNGVPSLRINPLIRNLQSDDVHVHLATGVSGIDARRLRSVPLSHEPMLYVEAASMSRTQMVIKRVFDIGVATIILVVASPVFLLVALAIRLSDRGPIFFKQQRVGRDGRMFSVYKFRSMFVDAEKHLEKLKGNNERSGPLFKMIDDPRVTRIGRVLRDTSLDELPQLINVLLGEMSLVGPRPALPAEVATFSDELRAREQVTPGITGLWQVEARDNPSFEAYRRLDLFYVENWSISLDLLILVATAEQLTVKLLSVVLGRKSKDKPSIAAADVPAVAATQIASVAATAIVRSQVTEYAEGASVAATA